MLYDILNIVLGISFLSIGGSLLVTHTSRIAAILKISPIIIGMVIIGFGTDIPELTISLSASLKESSDIAIGNVIGSTLKHLLLILGLGAIIYPIGNLNKTEFKNLYFMVFSIILFSLILYFNMLNKITSSILIFIFFAFIIYSYISDFKGKTAEQIENENTTIPKDWFRIRKCNICNSLIFSIISIIMLAIGSEILLNGAENIGHHYNISDYVIGLIIIAIGPELFTTAIAAYKKETGLIIGNIIGSNIFNSLVVSSISGLIHSDGISENLSKIYGLLPAIFSILLLFNFIVFKKINRLYAIFSLIAYSIYTFMLFS